ncbi:MAG: type II toxin-antitoxin system PemK/MazF family toxin [Euryarchaeota archaeon]|nr:type II toxin-antitoxin system PemK/MazF family toxin [Euryarchaeota archaeon]
MKRKFILVPFPFTDLTVSKLRPALVLFEGKRDVVVAFVSSKMPDGVLHQCIKIPESHEEFGFTGLKVASIVRLDKVATVVKDLIVGELGEAGPKLRKEVNKKIAEVYRI